MAVATLQGKEFALQALAQRQAENRGKERIQNESLPAGSPMTFYCVCCGSVADVLPEHYISIPKRLCNECQALKDCGWLE